MASDNVLSELIIKVKAEINEAKSKIIEIENQVKQSSNNIGTSTSKAAGSTFSMGNMFGSAATKATIYVAAAYAIGSALNSFAKKADEKNTLLKRLELQYGRNTIALRKYADELKEKTGIDENESIQLMTKFSRFTDNEEMIKKLTQATMDLAAATGQDLESAGQEIISTMSTARNGLREYGIEVKGAAGSNERMLSTLDALDKKFGGSSNTLTSDYTKAVNQLSNTWDDFATNIGSVVLPVITTLIDYLGKAFKFIMDLADAYNQLINPAYAEAKKKAKEQEELQLKQAEENNKKLNIKYVEESKEIIKKPVISFDNLDEINAALKTLSGAINSGIIDEKLKNQFVKYHNQLLQQKNKLDEKANLTEEELLKIKEQQKKEAQEKFKSYFEGLTFKQMGVELNKLLDIQQKNISSGNKDAVSDTDTKLKIANEVYSNRNELLFGGLRNDLIKAVELKLSELYRQNPKLIESIFSPGEIEIFKNNVLKNLNDLIKFDKKGFESPAAYYSDTKYKGKDVNEVVKNIAKEKSEQFITKEMPSGSMEIPGIELTEFENASAVFRELGESMMEFGEGLNTFSDAMGYFASAFGQHTAAFKAAAVVQATAAAYTAANKALVEVPFPLNLAAAAAVVTAGMLNIAKVVSAHEGGIFTSGQKISKFAAGADFIVPPGFPNDSFLMAVESGERVYVKPRNEVDKEKMKSIVLGNSNSDNVNEKVVKSINYLASSISNMKSEANISIDGKELTKVIISNTNELKNSGYDISYL